jgi:hypothetical protein
MKQRPTDQPTDGILIARVPSASKKGLMHDIRLDVNNMVYCDCTGWFFRHACTHMLNFRLFLASASVARQTGRILVRRRVKSGRPKRRR